jgi:16S rRNA (guanine(527)-N(7))-methyltransferase RsmG
MDTARIATLLHPFTDRTLPEVQLQQISTYIDLLLRWNAGINLTAIRDPDEIVTRHFGESFFLARHLFPDARVARAPSPAWPSNSTYPPKPEMQPSRPSSPSTLPLADSLSNQARPEPAEPTVRSTDPSLLLSKCRVLDIGSGAGFPGLPLKLWAPTISLTLIESNHKKSAFLREVARALTLTDVNVITARAETLAETAPSADIVTLRAVDRFDTILPIASKFVAPAGRLALLIGSSQLPNLASLAPAFRLGLPIPVPHSQSRVLTILVHGAKVGH